MDVNAKLCRNCRILISATTPTRENKYVPHHSTDTLFRFALKGCPLCATICEYFYAFFDEEKCIPRDPERHSAKAKLKYQLHRIEEPGAITRWVYYLYCRSPGKYVRMKEGYMGNLAVMPASETTSGAATTHTGSEQSWDLASAWIRECVTSHPKCNINKGSDWLPTRVVDVGTGNDPKLRLQHSTNLSSKEPYMTLSHCWGKLQIKQLNKNNLRSLLQHIEFSDLPKTFQDAVLFIRQHGVRYLWIDSLCIIQDSPEDWAFESATMGDVYKHAIGNIAATAAVDGSVGCFLERNPILAQPLRVRREPLKGLYSPTGLYDILPQDFWSHEITDAPLNQRAWVLQEQFLSRRIIHCGKNQLLWECRERAACEMYPKGIPRDFINSSYVSDFKWANFANDSQVANHSSVIQEQFGNPEQWKPVVLVSSLVDSSIATTGPQSKADALKLWDSIMFTYTKRSLTQFQDKLIAISAIAKEFQPLVQDEYLAGMWRTDLELALLWDIAWYYCEYESRPKTYSAPTWSWASVSGHISFFDPEMDQPVNDECYMIRIIECKTIPVAGDSTGQLAAGCIRIRGWLKTLKGLTLKYRPGETTHWVYWGENTFGNAVAMIKFDDHEFFPETDLSVLPILETKEDLLGDPEYVIRGLLLANTGKEGQYRRVGTFQSQDEGNRMFRRPLYLLDATLDLPIGRLSLDEKKTNVSRFSKPLQPSLFYSSSSSRTETLPELDEWVERIIEII